MLIHEGYNDLKLKNPVVTLGIFDGVHSGHKKLIEHLISRAGTIMGESVVITFHPHPRMVLEKEHGNIFFLTTLEEKIRLMKRTGINHMVILNFSPDLSRMKACDFVEEILVGKIGAKYLIVGHDHHFGHGGEGNYNTVIKCAQSSHFTVEKVKGYKTGEKTVSSSLIREALMKGDVERANNWLGYSYFLRGTVIEGKGLGRKLGFPTANIKPCDSNKLIPYNGVYAVEILLDKNVFSGMLSIGNNPTVNKIPGAKSIEVNIFNFEENIYGKDIEITFRYRLRDERKFENTEQLAGQMKKDRIRTIQLLG